MTKFTEPSYRECHIINWYQPPHWLALGDEARFQGLDRNGQYTDSYALEEVLPDERHLVKPLARFTIIDAYMLHCGRYVRVQRLSFRPLKTDKPSA